MSNTLDKDAVTWGQKQYHIALCPGEIGEYVLLPGDPARSDIAAPKKITEDENGTTMVKTMQAAPAKRSVALADVLAIKRGAKASPMRAEKPKHSKMMPSSPSVAPVMCFKAGMRDVMSP